MIIKYTNFSDGIHELEFVEPAEKLKLGSAFLGNVVLQCRMDKSSHQIILDCNVTAYAKLICDRCNSEFNKELHSHYFLSYLFSKSKRISDDENIKFLLPDSDKIDLTDDVVEYTKLSVPMKILCKEDCKGLCSKCGANLNEMQCKCEQQIENEVWLPLKNLLKTT
ncbi:DUF177 domain-containing protein [Melioribacteraceae bacterium 4301-Me]|uniref:YceD family protein n=1 Tax=Pyranulibacter aquaticus TaxID=3163344 RepID=UPI003598F886